MIHGDVTGHLPEDFRRQGLEAARRGEFDHARRYLENAINRGYRDPQTLTNLGAVCQALRDLPNALAYYQQALQQDPSLAQAWNNVSLVLTDMGQYRDAERSARMAIQLNPQYAEAHNNLGVALHSSGRKKEAHESYRQAIAINPRYARAIGNLGSLNYEMGQYSEALAQMQQALKLNPNTPFVAGLALHTRMRLCDWMDFDHHLQRVVDAIDANETVIPPFAALGLFDDPARHRMVSERWADVKIPVLTKRPISFAPTGHRARSNRIRVGYFSGDFHHHATGHLIASLIEDHDRDRFEIIAFASGPDSQDSMARRLRSAFDDYHDIREWNDEMVHEKALGVGLDIAVDLKGYTQDSRVSVFARRVAPIQVSYLGYPGTLGTQFIDYIITDHIVSPPGTEPYFPEALVRLPGSYQVNDRHRERPPLKTCRQEHGLPDHGLIIACFNNPYKITPDVFATWMKVLQKVPESFLWLLQDHPIAMHNLKKTCAQHGVDPNRVYFANRVATRAHLERHHHVDLFVDTFPYNAHTTASDALWMGVPIVTRTGQSFASRVAASLLHACGISDLVTDNLPDYEDMIVRLANDEPRRRALREKLQSAPQNSALFDGRLFTQRIEYAYSQMMERYRKGAPAVSFDLSP